MLQPAETGAMQPEAYSQLMLANKRFQKIAVQVVFLCCNRKSEVDRVTEKEQASMAISGVCKVNTYYPLLTFLTCTA